LDSYNFSVRINILSFYKKGAICIEYLELEPGCVWHMVPSWDLPNKCNPAWNPHGKLLLLNLWTVLQYIGHISAHFIPIRAPLTNVGWV